MGDDTWELLKTSPFSELAEVGEFMKWFLTHPEHHTSWDWSRFERAKAIIASILAPEWSK